MLAVALRKESVDRNISTDVSYSIIVKSLSARRAWIEIRQLIRHPSEYPVALRKESVDRNINCNSNFFQKKRVALRKESVDRNQVAVHFDTLSAVALRKESVDRNVNQKENTGKTVLSLSARRAWIEILLNPQYRHLAQSLSARRAWIEIGLFSADTLPH